MNYCYVQVLRKKYYNMVEDMKGKIRVYCRVRPLGRTEKDRVSFLMLGPPPAIHAKDLPEKSQNDKTHCCLFPSYLQSSSLSSVKYIEHSDFLLSQD